MRSLLCLAILAFLNAVPAALGAEPERAANVKVAIQDAAFLKQMRPAGA